MIRNALIIDTETTGLDPKLDCVIEVGMVLYSVEHQSTLMQFSTLLPAGSNPCESINRISCAALQSTALARANRTLEWVMTLSEFLNEPEVVVAHNAEFDRQFFPIDLPWLCTKFDFQWPRQLREGDSLINTALAHGIGVGSAHRALTDCQLIAALFDRMDDLQGMFERARRPKAIFQALVAFKDRELAKAAGFRWDADAKRWTRRMAIDDAGSLPFPVQMLGEVAA